jgi:hypothetical protein
LLTEESIMNRIVPLTLAAVLAFGVGAASAQGTKKAPAKVQTTTGVVKSVSASALELENGMKFAIDATTKANIKGVSAAQQKSGGARITDLVKTGDRVTVRYKGDAAAMMAVEIRKG